jgi:hypothetical protein
MSAATLVGPSFQPLLHFYMPALVKLLGRTNKLYISRTQACLTAIIQNTRLATVVPYLAEGMLDKTATARYGCVEALALCLVHIDKAALERKYLSHIEEVIRRGATDKEVKTREVAKQVWETFKGFWPERAEQCVRCWKSDRMI